MTTPAGGSQILFVVRNDASHSDIIYQTSDATWQAYNTYGGNSLYTARSTARPGIPAAYKGAYKVSLQPAVPHADDDQTAGLGLIYAEYPMVRFLEANGYDVSYMTGVDVDRDRGRCCINHKIFLSAGHDEYWSGNQRANVEAAPGRGRQPGVLQRQRDLLEDAVGAEHRRLEHAVPHAGLLQGDALQRPDRPAGPADVDRAPGATRGSARRPTAGGPRTR